MLRFYRHSDLQRLADRFQRVRRIPLDITLDVFIQDPKTWEDQYFRYVRDWPDSFEVFPMQDGPIGKPVTIDFNLN